jgi:arylsulfatase A-like enzyme
MLGAVVNIKIANAHNSFAFSALGTPKDSWIWLSVCISNVFIPTRAGTRSINPIERKEQPMASKQPNILILWGDDVGYWNISRNSDGMMGYRTPNIDRIANEGVKFTDWYGQQSCTAGRAAFITGQNPLRTGLTKVGLPGSTLGLQAEDPTIAELLKPLGYATGQFGKNHLGDRNEFLPTVHGFDEFFGNLYHLNAEEEPELPDYPKILHSERDSGRGGYSIARLLQPRIHYRPIRVLVLGESRPLKILVP